MKKEKNKPEKIKKPWPTKAAMEQVYEMGLWGTNGSHFYSGAGSHDLEVVNPYLKALLLFLKSFKKTITVCDLGCGDFNVGKELVKYSQKYIAVDIVENLIAYNKDRFDEENLEFYCLDIAIDPLPFADCAILRQVLQHLSNYEVQCVISKLVNFKYVLVTEHLPEGNFVPNKDIISGQGIRLKKKSGLDLLAPPFNLKVTGQKQLAKTVLNNNKGVIVTTLYQL